MFVDYTKINLKAGDGGDGIVAWRREKFEPSGGPYGGDGGNGGDIILVADSNIKTLLDFRYKRHYKAEKGENGRTKRQFGKAGENLYLRLPVGTLVKDAESGGVIVDLKNDGDEYLIVKGGRGGRGNAKFATATRRSPGFAEPGTKGQERDIILELKLIADAGLVGYPNVGKSTILSILSAAKPKIANYHFTTLEPNLGVVYVSEGNSFILADIPGLIEGAAEGVGLGHYFLRHIERTKCLVHVLDISGIEGRDPLEDFESINEELFSYNERLKEKEQIIVANKMDLPGAEENLERLKEEYGDKYTIVAVSAASMTDIDLLKYKINDLIKKAEENYDYTTYDEYHIEEEEDQEGFTVRKEGSSFIVEGPYVDYLMGRTYTDDYESLMYFQTQLYEKGIIDQLIELGIEDGDTVSMEGFEFEYYE